jgi:hypothetical protein
MPCIAPGQHTSDRFPIGRSVALSAPRDHFDNEAKCIGYFRERRMRDEATLASWAGHCRAPESVNDLGIAGVTEPVADGYQINSGA